MTSLLINVIKVTKYLPQSEVTNSEGITYINKINDSKETVQDVTPTCAKVTLRTKALLVSFIGR
jgi:hypothetical protein